MKLRSGAVALAIAVALPCVTTPADADPTRTATATRATPVAHQAPTPRAALVPVAHAPRETLGDKQLARVLEISATSVQPRPTLIPAVALPRPIAWAKVAPLRAHATPK